VWLDSFMCVTWLIHVCDMTYSSVWHDSFMCVTWLIHMCDMTYSYEKHDSFTCVPCSVHVCDMMHACRVATVSRIDKVICLFCRMLSCLLGSFAKETYNLIDPTDQQSHTICVDRHQPKCLVTYTPQKQQIHKSISALPVKTPERVTSHM